MPVAVDIDPVAGAERTQGRSLSLDAVSLDYGHRRAVDDVSFQLNGGEILSVLGPSGSGKSSILRLIAGLERPTSGAVVLDGRTVASADTFVEAHERRVGMVFQDFALFPHLTVAANVAFGLRGRTARERAARVGKLLAEVGLSDRGVSFPHTLSGGERQRVALVRALAPSPSVLLMDEPFSSLDTRLRDQVRDQTLTLLRGSGTTAVIVTHDPQEALRISDRIGVLENGKLVQFGTPDELYRRPCSPRMACAFGAVNVMTGTIDDTRLHTPLGAFSRPSGLPAGPVTVCIRPQHVALCGASGGIYGTVTGLSYVGDATDVRLHVNGVGVVARVTERPDVGVGDAQKVRVDPSHLFVFPHDDSSGVVAV